MIFALDDLLIQIFEHYYLQAYKRGYRVNKETHQSIIANFFKYLSKNGYFETSIGQNFLDQYIRFQIEYWHEKEIQRQPTLNWFIGKKAIERYFAIENREQSNYFVSLHTKDFKPFKIEDSEIPEHEIRARKIYHNTDKGLLHCLENTTLYNKCIPCLTCKTKEKCKELLKENYPLLWKKRMK